MNLFPLFFSNAGSQATRQKDLKQSQLRVAYTLLYYTGLRINEIREITQKHMIEHNSTIMVILGRTIHNRFSTKLGNNLITFLKL